MEHLGSSRTPTHASPLGGRSPPSWKPIAGVLEHMRPLSETLIILAKKPRMARGWGVCVPHCYPRSGSGACEATLSSCRRGPWSVWSVPQVLGPPARGRSRSAGSSKCRLSHWVPGCRRHLRGPGAGLRPPHASQSASGACQMSQAGSRCSDLAGSPLDPGARVSACTCPPHDRPPPVLQAFRSSTTA